jgi:hypothetical protein
LIEPVFHPAGDTFARERRLEFAADRPVFLVIGDRAAAFLRSIAPQSIKSAVKNRRKL